MKKILFFSVLFFLISFGFCEGETLDEAPSDKQINKEFGFIYNMINSGVSIYSKQIRLKEDDLIYFQFEEGSFNSDEIIIKKYSGYFTDSINPQCVVLVTPKGYQSESLRLEQYCVLFFYSQNNKNRNWVLNYVAPFYNDLELYQISKVSKISALYVNQDYGMEGRFIWLRGIYKLDKDKGLLELYLSESYSNTMNLSFIVMPSEDPSMEIPIEEKKRRLGNYKPGDTLGIEYGNIELIDQGTEQINEMQLEETVSIIKTITTDRLIYIKVKRKMLYKYKNSKFVFFKADPSVQEEVIVPEN